MPIKMSCLPRRKVMPFMNSSATVTVGTWVTHRKDSNSESDSMFQNESDLELMQQEHNPQDRIRKQLHSQTAILLLGSICGKK